MYIKIDIVRYSKGSLSVLFHSIPRPIEFAERRCVYTGAATNYYLYYRLHLQIIFKINQFFIDYIIVYNVSDNSDDEHPNFLKSKVTSFKSHS